MCESRVLCEICKVLWEPFLGFHRTVISTAVFVAFFIRHIRDRRAAPSIEGMLFFELRADHRS